MIMDFRHFLSPAFLAEHFDIFAPPLITHTPIADDSHFRATPLPSCQIARPARI